uniref:AB hydrolase-1 domain-containing protein n=1 Tax=Oryza barthii TaxID=65489 RepID=A0A0D3G6U4_9ORYZ
MAISCMMMMSQAASSTAAMAPRDGEGGGRRHHFVLVHGLCHGAWCWYRVATALRRAGHRVTALDMAAAGASPARVDEVRTFEDYSRPLLAALAALLPSGDGERVVLVGHSHGGFSVALAAERFPERLAAVVFLTASMPPVGRAMANTTDELTSRTNSSNIGKVAVEDRIFGRSAANRVYRVAVRWCAGGSGAAFAAICSAACGWGATKRPVREGRKGRRPAAARERPHPRFKRGQSRLRVEGGRGEGKHRLPSASRLREKRKNGPREYVSFVGADFFLDSRVLEQTNPDIPGNPEIFGPNFMAQKLYQLSPPEDLTLALSLIRPANRFTGDALMRDAGLLTKERYGSTRRVFVVVEDDHAIPVEFQRRMVAENPGVEVVDIAGADHMAMISKPAKLADLLVILARYQEPGTNAPSLVVQPSMSHVRARRRRPHPPLSTTHHSSSPTAVSFVIHAPH